LCRKGEEKESREEKVESGRPECREEKVERRK
jgi:hypothetical protein